MELAVRAYGEDIVNAKDLIRRGSIAEAIQCAVSAWQHLDGMMRYQKKYAQIEFDSVECIDLVCEYAPIVLDYESLDALESLLGSQRRIDRNTSESLSQKLGEARARLRVCWGIIDYFERLGPQPELPRDVGTTESRVSAGIVEKLIEHGVLLQRGGHFRLVTRMHELWIAKCCLCGVRCQAPKRRFLAYTSCPSCARRGAMTLIEPAGASGGSE